MTFTLEALRAKHGDSLLLHYGEPGETRLVLIDGGPSGVYHRFLRPRLEELRQERGEESLRLEKVVVSHIDDDHIRGLLDLTRELRNLAGDDLPQPFDLRGLWHNSFDDVVGERVERLAEAARDVLTPAATADDLPPGLGREHPAAIVLASVKQGRQLRLDAATLGLAVNRGDGEPLVATGEARDLVPLRGGLRLRIVGPLAREVERLQKEWDRELERLGLAEKPAVEVAAYLDESVFNLASLVLVAELGDRRMLLTGDARGDTVLAGLEQAGLLAPGAGVHFDLVKLPHHGSDRNVDDDFFERITADHYIVSGDGRHGNPEPKALEMLFRARGAEPFDLHLTYAPDEMINEVEAGRVAAALESGRQAGARFALHTPGAGRTSLLVDLAG
jgi:hypothetical protein